MKVASQRSAQASNARQRAGVKISATKFVKAASNSLIDGVLEKEVTMWNRRDWDEFFNIVMKRSRMQRPPRPLDMSRRNRLVPAEGYSLAELDDVGLSIEQAEFLGLPVDAGRVGSYGPNVSTLREYVRASRTRL
jgi:ribosomal protein L13E